MLALLVGTAWKWVKWAQKRMKNLHYLTLSFFCSLIHSHFCLLTYIPKRVFHDDISRRQKDEIPACHSNKFLPNHDYEQAASIQPAIYTKKSFMDVWLKFSFRPSLSLCRIIVCVCIHQMEPSSKCTLRITYDGPLLFSFLCCGKVLNFKLLLLLFIAAAAPFQIELFEFSIEYIHKIMQQIGNLIIW